MEQHHDRPSTAAELAGLDGSVTHDLRPWGRGVPEPGAVLLDEDQSAGRVLVRSDEERLRARQTRADRRASARVSSVDAFRPHGVPAAYRPGVPAERGRALVGRSARGGVVGLSTTVVLTQDGDVHTTIIDGESRVLLYPDHYPFTAVCKLELWRRGADGRWGNTGVYASGFLVGRRILMTSGHAFADQRLSEGNVAIKVIPACWANQPVFGPGLVTWVQRRRWWHSDSGNDLQLCQLADPVGDSVGYFGIRVYDSDWEDRASWTMAGFPYDRSKYAMSAQFGIAVRDDDDGDDIDLDGTTYDTTQVENDADESSGASGSPLFGWFGADNPCAIGVHSGYQTDWTVGGDETWSCAAGGDGLHAIVRWGRDSWD